MRSGGQEVIESGSTLVTAEVRPAHVDEAYFDEGLLPKSTMRYEPRGAVIGPPHVETALGRRVNVLQTGSEYVYTYTVKFDESAFGVRFGMLIKTTTGLPLGGSVTATNAGNGISVTPGKEFVIRFRFRAMLTPGVYFLNAGVTAIDAEGEIYLDRMIDATMFRIMPDSETLATGTVDFDVEPEFECAVGSVE